MAVILVVDDEDSIRGFVALALESAGHEVLKARNGIEAVSLFRSYPNSIDLVLTDLMMPGMDGYEVVERIRQTRPAARIVCMSGYAAEELPEDVVFLPKPFALGSLIAEIDRALAGPPPDRRRT